MDALSLIERTIVLLQADKPLPPDVAKWLECGLRKYRDTPGSSLDKILGLKSRQGKRNIWYTLERRDQLEILGRHYREYHCGMRSKYLASCVIAKEFEIIEAAYGQRTQDAGPLVRYVSLYQQLAALPFAVPGQMQLYRLLKRS